MTYIGPFKDVIYPNANQEPHIARYRIALIPQAAGARAIVHLLRSAAVDSQMHISEAAFDTVLNRIVGTQLAGVRLDRIQFVVQTGDELVTYPIRFNALDLAPRSASRSRGSKDHAVHIRSHDVVGGAVAFYVDQDGGKPASAIVERLLLR
ncbi:hypothetical protein C2L64_46705 [Paraburkholderia hospita]|uniref:Uncharacterized protein n=2 Tax=Paraburkholderia hospita TaxID=169430 RepID=A0AAN1MQI2_9BURK|nr:hypothetical protein C2L64_46705 [Paraburkholderia hospita]